METVPQGSRLRVAGPGRIGPLLSVTMTTVMVKGVPAAQGWAGARQGGT